MAANGINKEVRNETTPSQDVGSLGEVYFDFEAFLYSRKVEPWDITG